MRRTPLIASLAVGVLALTAACSSGSNGTAAASPSATGLSPSASSSASPAPSATTPPPVGSDTGGVTASGAFGSKPTLAFPAGKSAPSGLQRSVLKQGSGTAVRSGDLLAVNYLGQVWNGKVFDSSWDHNQVAAFSIGVGQIIPGWDNTLVGVKTGSRVLLTIPPDQGYGSAGNSAAGIKGTDTLVFVVDVLDSYGPKASGDPKATPRKVATDIATVSGALGAEAKVSVVKGAAQPTALKGYVLAKGNGKPVTNGTVVVQYAVADWAGAQSASTWTQGGPQGVDPNQAGSPFTVLKGVPVGSRVLIVVPATQGSAATGTTPSTSPQPALAAVVDVVAQPTASG